MNDEQKEILKTFIRQNRLTSPSSRSRSFYVLRKLMHETGLSAMMDELKGKGYEVML